MADDIDLANNRVLTETSALIAAASADLPVGHPGDCDLCGVGIRVQDGCLYLGEDQQQDRKPLFRHGRLHPRECRDLHSWNARENA